MTQPTDKAALPLIVQELLRQNSGRRDALRRLGYGALAVSPLTLVGCGGEDSKGKAGAGFEKLDPAPLTETFSIGLNSNDTVRDSFYGTRLYQHETVNRASDNWTLIATNSVDNALTLFQPPSVPVAITTVIPAERNLQSVDDIRLQVHQPVDMPAPMPCTIYAVAQNHAQGQETYLMASAGQAWETAGGPSLGAPLGTIVLGGSAGAKVSSSLQGLFNDVAAINNGFIIKSDGGPQYGVLWMSSQSDGIRPKLMVTYTHVGASEPPPPPPPPSGAFRVGANQGNYDWMPSQFADLVENSRGFMKTNQYEDDGSLRRDAQNWPLEASRFIGWVPDAQVNFPTGQVFKGSYSGPGTIRSEIGGVVISNLVRNGNDVSFDMVVETWPAAGIFNFSDAISNLSIYFPGTNASTFLRPEAAAQGGLFWVHRFMQAAGILQSNFEVSWGARKPAGNKIGYKPWESIFAWAVGYVNSPGSRTGAGWFQVPRCTNPDYQTQLAQLAASRVPGNVIQYWGLGNELWNGLYANFYPNIGMGQPLSRALNPGDPDFARINTPPTDNQYERMHRLIGLEFARMAKRFLAVFGQSSFGTRLRPVLEAQHANPWSVEVPLQWLSLPAQVAEFGAVNTYCWSISGAPYPAGEWAEMDIGQSPTPESILRGLRDGYEYDMPFMLNAADGWVKLRAQYNIPELTAYEGITPHTDGAFAQQNSVNKYGAHTHPDVRRLVYDFGLGLQQRGYGACCYFVGYPGKFDPNNLYSLWGVNQFFGEDSYKMLGVKDLIALSAR